MCGRECHARLQAADDVIGVVPAARELLRRERSRYPDGGLGDGVTEIGQHDADHRSLQTIERDRATDETGIRTEPPLPEIGADDRHRQSVRAIVVGHERATERGLHAQRRKQVRRRPHAGQAFRFTAAREVVAHG